MYTIHLKKCIHTGAAPVGYHQQHGLPPSKHGSYGDQHSIDSSYGGEKGGYQVSRGSRSGRLRDRGPRKFDDFKEPTAGNLRPPHTNENVITEVQT